MTNGQLYELASTGRPADRHHRGVSRVQDVRLLKSAIRIKADPRAFAARDMSVDDLSAAIRQGTSYAGASSTAPTARSCSSPKRSSRRPGVQQPHRRTTGGLPEGRRGRRPVVRRRDMRFWVRDRPLPAATVVVAVYRHGAQRGGGGRRGEGPAAARVSRDHAIRPLAVDRQQRQRREGDALHRVRPRRDRDLRLPRPRDRHADPRRRAPAVAAADVHRDGGAGVQPRQPVAHGG